MTSLSKYIYKSKLFWLGCIALLALSACGKEEPPIVPQQGRNTESTKQEPAENKSAAEQTTSSLSVTDSFWTALSALCGNRYPGQLTVGTEESDREFGLAKLEIHVERCKKDAIDINLSVDEDNSRTWLIRRNDNLLSLHHRHLGEDGKEDETSGYGGNAQDEGSISRQEFPADAHTAELIPKAATNIWALEIIPNQMFAYELRREDDLRAFRVVFDISQ